MAMRSFVGGRSFAKSRGFLLLLLATLLCAPALGQISGFQRQQTAQKHALSGTVINASTREPVPYALVQAGEYSKLADQNGNFHFEDLPYTQSNIVAHKPGFFNDQEMNEQGPPQMITLSDPPLAVTLRLTPEAVLSGHVENPEGNPLQGLPVLLRGSRILNGRRMWQQMGGGSTDEDGNFRIAGLRPGTYYAVVGPHFRARPVDEPPDAKPKFEVIPAEYYPGVRDRSAASPIVLAAGQHASIELGMKRVPAYRIAGAVAGSAANGGLALFDNEGENTNIGIRYDSQIGRFQAFPVPAGSYHLRFNGQDGNNQQVFADLPINVSGDLPELRVSVQHTINIPMEVQTEFTRQDGAEQPTGLVGRGPQNRYRLGSPEANAGLRGATYVQIHLNSRKPPYQPHYPSREKPEDPMVFRGLEPGTYDVEADPNGMAYVSSITCNGVNLLREPLVIAEGADPQPIEVTVRDDGASIDGSVQIPEGQMVNVVMVGSDGEAQPRPIFMGNSGKFQIRGIAPGDYEILAFDRLDGIEYRNREALKNYLSRATHVTLSADQQAQVNVDLIRTTQ